MGGMQVKRMWKKMAAKESRNMRRRGGWGGANAAGDNAAGATKSQRRNNGKKSKMRQKARREKHKIEKPKAEYSQEKRKRNQKMQESGLWVQFPSAPRSIPCPSPITNISEPVGRLKAKGGLSGGGDLPQAIQRTPDTTTKSPPTALALRNAHRENLPKRISTELPHRRLLAAQYLSPSPRYRKHVEGVEDVRGLCVDVRHRSRTTAPDDSDNDADDGDEAADAAADDDAEQQLNSCPSKPSVGCASNPHLSRAQRCRYP